MAFRYPTSFREAACERILFGVLPVNLAVTGFHTHAIPRPCWTGGTKAKIPTSYAIEALSL